jgi:hypothetical protein
MFFSRCMRRLSVLPEGSEEGDATPASDRPRVSSGPGWVQAHGEVRPREGSGPG